MLGLDLSNQHNQKRPVLSVIVPVHNEESNLENLFARLNQVVEKWDHEIIVVDDGSFDNTLNVLKDEAKSNKNLKVLSFSRNFGHQVAVTTGLEYSSGEAVVIIDADLQDPPEVIPDMIEKWKEGFDVVYGQRVKREGEGIFKKLTASLFYRLMRNLTPFTIPVDTGDFRLVSRRVVRAFLSMPERHRFVRGMFAWVGFKQVGVPYVRHERFKGSTKYTVGKMMRLAFDAITSFSYVPLKFASYIGFLSAVVGFVLIIYTLYQKLYGIGTMRGWASLSVIVLFLGGIQLLMIGLLGEYMGQVHDELKQRPLYIVKESINIEPPVSAITPQLLH